MESWVQLLDIFINSPCPETEASQWLRQSFNPTSSSISISTGSFLSLLTNPTDAILVDSSPPSSSPSPQAHTKRIMWIQTLPNVVQACILCFLAYDHKRFCALDLFRFARNLLSDDQGLEFWVKRAAHHLLDMVSDSNYEWVSCLNLDSEGENVDEDFRSLPDWLKEAASDGGLVLPWLPISSDELNTRMPVGTFGVIEDSLSEDEHVELENLDEVGTGVDFGHPSNGPLNSEIEKMAAILKSRILNFESTSKTVELVDEIRKLCNGRGGDSLAVLSLMESWKAEDETA